MPYTGDQRVNPILTTFVTVGTIVASVVPIFANSDNTFIKATFIDTSIAPFAAVSASIVMIVLIWQINSEIGRQIFTQDGPSIWQRIGIGFSRWWSVLNKAPYNAPKYYYNQRPEAKVQYVVRFIFFVILFYAAKPFSLDHPDLSPYISLIQFTAYVLAFYCLGVALGLTIWQSLNTSRYNEIRENRIERIREALIKQGILRVELEVLHVGEEFGPNKEVYFRTNNKLYRGWASNDFQQIIGISVVAENSVSPHPDQSSNS